MPTALLFGFRMNESPIIIDQWITAAGSESYGPWCVIDDIPATATTARELIVKLDRDGHDASRSTGAEGVDWEYVYLNESEATRA